jgi:catechol 2,3-dioxygenase
VSNDELDHRIVFFEVPEATVYPERRGHTGLQHVAFSCTTIDDLLGTYVRLKKLGILPLWAADHGVGMSLYYQDPDQNRVEINASNYNDAWTATEHVRVSRGMMMAHVDPEKMGCGAWGGRFALGVTRRCGSRRIRSRKAVLPGCKLVKSTSQWRMKEI